MKFLVDNQLPADLARWLRSKGVDAVHVLERGLSEKDDLYLWQLAVREDRVVVSKDEDFFNLGIVLTIGDGFFGAVWEISGRSN